MATVVFRMTPDLKFSLGLAATGLAIFALIVVCLLMMGQIYVEMPR
jgi:uncharacterized transporter YbjL